MCDRLTHVANIYNNKKDEVLGWLIFTSKSCIAIITYNQHIVGFLLDFKASQNHMDF